MAGRRAAAARGRYREPARAGDRAGAASCVALGRGDARRRLGGVGRRRRCGRVERIERIERIKRVEHIEHIEHIERAERRRGSCRARRAERADSRARAGHAGHDRGMPEGRDRRRDPGGRRRNRRAPALRRIRARLAIADVGQQPAQ
ncbi:non-ribosomal peptide synthase domain protein [Burkholderia pseudomallei MSHR5613]|nr:non-ribosomal peptide synthase domain protein [Burkholderia pseudomallei MSHR5613]